MRTRQICHKTLLSLALLGVLAGCGQSSGPGSSGGGEGSLTLLTIGTADSGGTMYQAGSAIVQAITQEDSSIKINISASTGSNMNVNSLASGEVDLALVSGDVAYAAEAGDSGLKAPEGGLRAIAAVYSSVSSWTVLADSSYVYVHELTGATVGVGPEGSSTDLSAQVAISALALREQGTSLINCGLGDGARLLANGDLDAVHGFTGMPIPSITDLSEKEPCRLLLYTPEELSAILAENPVYYAAQIPAGGSAERGRLDGKGCTGHFCSGAGSVGGRAVPDPAGERGGGGPAGGAGDLSLSGSAADGFGGRAGERV